MANIPTYEQWMRETAGAFYEKRNDYLKSLDNAIKDYHDRGRSAPLQERVKVLLDAYVDDHDARKGAGSWKKSIRNAKGAVEQLLLSFVLPAVPRVDEPALPPSPPPRPPAPRIPAGDLLALKFISKLKVRVHDRHEINAQLTPHETEVARAIDSLVNDLGFLYTNVNIALVHTKEDFRESLRFGYNTFKGLHSADAEDIDFKLSLVKNMFKAMESLPFPLSTIGQVAGGIVGAFKTEQFKGETEALTVRMPDPQGMALKVAGLAEKIDGFRTLNVHPAKLKQFDAVSNQFLSAFRDYEDALLAVWTSEIASIKDATTRLKLARQMVAASLPNLQAFTTVANRIGTNVERDKRIRTIVAEIPKLGEPIFTKFADLKNRRAVNRDEVARWVTVMLIADYAIVGLLGLTDRPGEKEFSDLTADELAAKSIGNTYAGFLDKEVGLLKFKTDSGESASTYAEGKIPWADHPTHRIAVFLYLDWMRRSINPFDLFRQGCTVQDFEGRSRDYIKRLGIAIKTHQQTHWFTHNTVDDVKMVIGLTKHLAS